MTTEKPNLRWRYAGAAFIVLLLTAGLALTLTSSVARRFGLMGAEHILSGFDHLTFLVMLMIVARQIKELIFIATAFTLAHSITLTAATLKWVQASPAWVEPLIVLTILYVAIENVINAAPKARLPVTFGFGLIHGLGFAGALAEGPLPRAEELIALFSFNLGVEFGQILFLAVSFLLWRALLKFAPEPGVRRIASGLTIMLCGYWLWQRLS